MLSCVVLSCWKLRCLSNMSELLKQPVNHVPASDILIIIQHINEIIQGLSSSSLSPFPSHVFSAERRFLGC